jgi:hypothetical protein
VADENVLREVLEKAQLDMFIMNGRRKEIDVGCTAGDERRKFAPAAAIKLKRLNPKQCDLELPSPSISIEHNEDESSTAGLIFLRFDLHQFSFDGGCSIWSEIHL